jgi:hypothetical protein
MSVFQTTPTIVLNGQPGHRVTFRLTGQTPTPSFKFERRQNISSYTLTANYQYNTGFTADDFNTFPTSWGRQTTPNIINQLFGSCTDVNGITYAWSRGGGTWGC